MKKTSRLKASILDPPILVMPGAHDALSARIIEKAGFQALVVGGYPATAALMGKPDISFLTLPEMVDHLARLTDAVDIPILVDADTGHGGVLNVARTVREFERAGAAGLFIEDQVFPKRCGHMEGKQVIPAEEMAGKVRAMADVRARLGRDIVINARTDAFAVEGLTGAIRRANLYLEAGADMAFLDGIGTRADIERAARDINGLLSVNLMDAVTGVKTELIPIPELAAMGVARVSIPVASIMVMHKALKDFFTALHSSPTGILAGDTHRLTSFKEYTAFVGLPEYRAKEHEYLPALKGCALV